VAVPAYTTDLTDLADLDTTGGTAVEPASLWLAGRSPAEDDTDFPIQGTVHASLTMNTTGKAGVLVPGNAFTWVSGEYLFGWIIWLAPAAIATKASGGLAMICGSSASVFDVHYVGGSDYGSYPYGGWQNFAVDPERTPDENAGTPTAYHYVGAGANVLSAVSKGNPLGFDAFRYGRGEFRVAGGSVGDGYASFLNAAETAGMAFTNDTNTNRWGLFQQIEGGFKFKGHMILGYVSATEFVDANKSIVVDVTGEVGSDFNKIEIRNASSIIDLTNIAITQLGVGATYATASQCNFVATDNATISFDTCVFTDLSTFVFNAGTNPNTIVGSTFRRCGLITTGGASFAACNFDTPSGAVGVTASSPANAALITASAFNSDGTGNGLEITGTAADMALTDVDFNGYSTTVDADKAIYVNIATGTMEISISGGSGVTADSHVRTAGATVTVASSVPVTITVLDDSTGSPIATTARVTILNDATKAELDSAAVNASGVYSYSYTGGTPLDISGWVREFSLTGTDYIQQEFSGEITSNGFSLTIRLVPIT
jgi:hypothetical protein